MTAQIPDEFVYRGERHALAGISEGRLFDPGQLGLAPEGVCTACWRGYQAIYALDGPHLVLAALAVNLMKPGEGYVREPGPVIDGIAPVDPGDDPGDGTDAVEPRLRYSSPRTSLFNNLYDDLRYPLPYTGGVLLARGFIRELYVHMGFHPAWKFEHVFELIFEGGVLRHEHDRSAAMAGLRQKYREAPPSHESLKAYIESAFDQRY